MFVDGMFRPLTLALVVFLWSIRLAEYVSPSKVTDEVGGSVDGKSGGGAATAARPPMPFTDLMAIQADSPKRRAVPSSQDSSTEAPPLMAQRMLHVAQVARDFFSGESSTVEDPQVPWELRARWKMLLRVRWLIASEIVFAGLFVAMLVWQANSALVSCGVLLNPESGACVCLVAPSHIALVRPRVFGVITLLCNSILFVGLVVTGLRHFERVTHVESRMAFRRTFLLVLLFQGVSVFSFWCRIFDQVRFTPSFAFFVFVDDIASMALLWTLSQHMRTAAKRRATGPIAERFRALRTAARRVVEHVQSRFMSTDDQIGGDGGGGSLVSCDGERVGDGGRNPSELSESELGFPTPNLSVREAPA
jgi:hypothetical protein